MTFLGSLLAGVGFSIQMSGRGRGRGRGAVPPSVASAPFSYGSSNGSNASGSTQAIYTSRTEPSQKFPDILIPEAPKFENFSDFEIKSVESSERIDSLLRISPSFRPVKTSQAKIDRYSDKYLSHVIYANDKKERLNLIETNLEFFPEELHVVYHEPGASKASRKKSSVSSTVSFKDTISQLDTLAQKEESNNEEEAEKGNDDDEEGQNEELEDEEFEDETDYNYSYFDNGEDHGDYDDGNDEAVF